MTGGWDMLALQTHYPNVFGGAWGLYPDQLDFRNYQFGNVYADTNACVQVDGSWLPREIPSSRTGGPNDAHGAVEYQVELVIAWKGQSSGAVRDGRQAGWAAVGADVCPKPLWDKKTGHVNKDVAEAMRSNGSDLRARRSKTGRR
jgi:hypothetical protein